MVSILVEINLSVALKNLVIDGDTHLLWKVKNLLLSFKEYTYQDHWNMVTMFLVFCD